MSWIQKLSWVAGWFAIFLVLRVEYAPASAYSAVNGSLPTVIDYQLFTKYPRSFCDYCRFVLLVAGHQPLPFRLYFDDIYHSFLIQLTALVFLIIMWSFTYKSGPVEKYYFQYGFMLWDFSFSGYWRWH